MTDLLTAAEPAPAAVARRTCESCKGTGLAYKWDHEVEAKPCYSCRGEQTMPAPDLTAIIAAIKGRRGLCSARPKNPRAYFVWRLARFHGGADVTLPMGAYDAVRGDPWKPELEALAEAVAKRAFGTDMAAAHRWGGLLVGSFAGKDAPGLPATAYESGPVLGFGAVKPDEERAELGEPE